MYHVKENNLKTFFFNLSILVLERIENQSEEHDLCTTL